MQHMLRGLGTTASLLTAEPLVARVTIEVVYWGVEMLLEGLAIIRTLNISLGYQGYVRSGGIGKGMGRVRCWCCCLYITLRCGVMQKNTAKGAYAYT